MQTSFQPIQNAILVICGIVFFIVLVLLFFVLLYRKSHNLYLREKALMQSMFEFELAKTQLETQEATLEAVGNELHDNIGQLLNSTKMLIGVTQRILPQVPEPLNVAETSLTKALAEIRQLSKSLNKEWLQQFSFTENLYAEATRINASGALNMQVLVDGDIWLKPNEQVMLFRIVQELLQNTLKHAKATTFGVQVQSHNKGIDVAIADDGNGFIPSPEQNGLGLISAEKRTRLLGGSIKWLPNSPKGSQIILHIPATNI